jgi:hypothetical protein
VLERRRGEAADEKDQNSGGKRIPYNSAAQVLCKRLGSARASTMGAHLVYSAPARFGKKRLPALRRAVCTDAQRKDKGSASELI